MKVVRNKVVMAALLALLAIKCTSAALAAIGPRKLMPPTLGLGMNSLLPTQPGINSNGQCPTYRTLVPFTKTAFDDVWFVYKQSLNLIETGWTCKKLTYNELTNAFIYSYRQFGVEMSYAGTYSVPILNRGVISVQLQNVFALGTDSTARVIQFVVAGVATDYMIIKSCSFFPAVPGLLGHNVEYVYVLTRARVPTAAVTTAIARAATTAGIGSSVLQTVVQTGC